MRAAGATEDIPLIGELAKNMLGRTFCPLGDAAAMPTISIVKKWRNEFEDHLARQVRVQSRRSADRGRALGNAWRKQKHITFKIDGRR